MWLSTRQTLPSSFNHGQHWCIGTMVRHPDTLENSDAHGCDQGVGNDWKRCQLFHISEEKGKAGPNDGHVDRREERVEYHGTGQEVRNADSNATGSVGLLQDACGWLTVHAVGDGDLSRNAPIQSAGIVDGEIDVHVVEGGHY